MVTNHWLQGGLDGTWTAGSAQPAINLAIPAGGIMKRFLMRAMSFQGYSTGVGFNAPAPLRLTMTVDITTGPDAPRNIYETMRVIPSRYVALYDNATLQRVYTQYIEGGDNELAFNQRCSYGTRAGPGFNVRLTMGVFPLGGALTTPAGSAKYTFRVLYEI